MVLWKACKQVASLFIGRAVDNNDLIRWICGQVNLETDLEKTDELLRLLKAVIQNNLEEVRIRMEYLRKEYAMVFQQEKAADPEPGEP